MLSIGGFDIDAPETAPVAGCGVDGGICVGGLSGSPGGWPSNDGPVSIGGMGALGTDVETMPGGGTFRK